MPMPQGPEAMLRAMAWERAKGDLRACVVASVTAEPLNSDDDRRQRERWIAFDEKVEAFIGDVENNGMNE